MKRIIRVLAFWSIGTIVSAAALEPQFIVITSLYNELHSKRLSEFVTCLEKNLVHAMIKHIHVIYDTSKDGEKTPLIDYLATKPITLTYLQGRPSFGYLFDLATTLYPDQKVIICNADIYFNDTLNLLGNYSFDNVFMALTRWNSGRNGKLKPFRNKHGSPNIFSQDTWIFKTPVRKFDQSHFLLGTWTCDSLIAAQAYNAGYSVVNPCLSIQCCHMHKSKVRNYSRETYSGFPAKGIAWTTLS